MTLDELRSELGTALALVRTGDHDAAEPRLLAAARHLQSHGPSGELIPPERATEAEQLKLLLRMRTIALLAEIADRAGNEELAEAALRPVARVTEHLEELRGDAMALVFPSDKDLRWKLLRQEIFCAWCVVVRAYRRGDTPLAIRTADAAIAVAEQMTPQSDGLLAQLYYARAKLRLRERDFLEATVEFRKSLDRASRRLSEAGDNAVERQAAQYSVGKALGLGLAQALLDQGRMEEAHTVAVAGVMLLDLTPDLVHRHYARQLLGSIQRSSARDGDCDQDLLIRAEKDLASCEDFFAAKKPSAVFRSRYERALIALHRGQLDAAEQAMRALCDDASNAGSPKWMANARVGMSRVMRRARNFPLAVQEAERARKIADMHRFRTIAIKAHTAFVQALFDQHAASPEQLPMVERQVRELLQEVPEHDVRSRVVALLVLVRVLAARGDLRRARATYEEYERIAHLVQSPRIRASADAALQVIFPVAADAFRCPVDQTPADYDLERNRAAVEQHVLAKAELVYPDKNQRADVLGISRSTLYRSLEEGNPIRPKVRRRGRDE